jgi:hypothetical protein
VTTEQVESLVKADLDAGLKVTTVANNDGSTTVKVSTSFTVGASATEADIQAAVKRHLTAAQAVFHTLACAY